MSILPLMEYFVINGVNYLSTNKIVGGVDFLAIRERAFYGPR